MQLKNEKLVREMIPRIALSTGIRMSSARIDKAGVQRSLPRRESRTGVDETWILGVYLIGGALTGCGK